MKRFLITLICSTILGTGFTQTWNQVTVPTSENLNDIEFPEGTAGIGYIGGDNGVLLKTIDGGLSWFNVEYAGIESSEFTPLRFVDLEFVSDAVGFATFGYEVGWGLYKTVDGGLNWTEIMPEQDLGSFCYKHTLEVIDENHYFVGGRACFSGPEIAEFNNGEWSLKQVASDFFNSGEYVKDIKMHGQLGIASTSSSEFLRTTDGGQSWSSITSPILSLEDNLTDVIIINDTIMYAGMNNFGPSLYSFFESTDSGETWFQVLVQGDIIMYASWFTFEQTNNGVLHASATNDINEHFMHSSFDGVWSYELIDEKVLAIDSYGLNNTFGVGENGFVIFNGSNAAITEQDIEVKVYPNPASDFITLELDNETESLLKIYDQLGALLYNTSAQGNKTINISQWRPGVYTLKLESNTHFLIEKFVKR
tara:strand:+ start:1619 stop:2884 length:1266 start_codon:yes stop_codon:yes gene_type:complete